MSVYYWVYIMNSDNEIVETAGIEDRGCRVENLPSIIQHMEEKYRDKLQSGEIRIMIRA